MRQCNRTVGRIASWVALTQNMEILRDNQSSQSCVRRLCFPSVPAVCEVCVLSQVLRVGAFWLG